MTFDFLHRIRQELRVTLTAAEETVLAVAERVNRKVQLLRLHWQASQVQAGIAGAHRAVGRHLTADIPGQNGHESGSGARPEVSPETQTVLLRSRHLAQELKGQLGQIESRIVAMQSEAIREDLLRFTRDLEFRGMTLQYLIVARGAPMAGRPLQHVAEMAGIHVVGLIRGPLVMDPGTEQVLQAGDGLLVMGPPAAVATCRNAVTASRAMRRAIAANRALG